MLGTILARVLQAVDIMTLVLFLMSKWFGVGNVSARQLTFVLIGTMSIEIGYTVVHILTKVYKE